MSCPRIRHSDIIPVTSDENFARSSSRVFDRGCSFSVSQWIDNEMFFLFMKVDRQLQTGLNILDTPLNRHQCLEAYRPEKISILVYAFASFNQTSL